MNAVIRIRFVLCFACEVRRVEGDIQNTATAPKSLPRQGVYGFEEEQRCLEETPVHKVRKEESVGAAKRQCDGEGNSKNPPVVPAPQWTGDALNRYMDKSRAFIIIMSLGSLI